MSGHPSTNGEWIRVAISCCERLLTHYAARLVGDLERGRDVVQETFLRLCRQKQARVEPHLAEWLYTVCRNRALDVRRKENRMSPMTELQTETWQSADPAPSETMERAENESRILQTLAALPERQREVIRLKFQHGLSYKEIARVTDLTVFNVGLLIHTGIKTLREKMQQQKKL
jgi:RNA polymerase sigma-70 factor (ECF subfamily)